LVRVKSPEEIAKRIVMGSIFCYLRGEKNLNWVVGMIRSSGIRKNVFQNLFSAIRESYAEKPRFQELEKKSKELGYL